MITIKYIDRELCGLALDTPQGELVLQVVQGLNGVPVIYIETPDWDEGPAGARARVWFNEDLVFEGQSLDNPDDED